MAATTHARARQALPEEFSTAAVGDRLRRARALISHRSRWTMGDHASSADGSYVLASSPDAVAWCGLGAYLRVGGDRYDAVHNYLDGIARELFAEARTSDPDTLGGLVLVNDWVCWEEWFDEYEDPVSEAHRRVLQIYDAAIDRVGAPAESTALTDSLDG